MFLDVHLLSCHLSIDTPIASEQWFLQIKLIKQCNSIVLLIQAENKVNIMHTNPRHNWEHCASFHESVSFGEMVTLWIISGRGHSVIRKFQKWCCSTLWSISTKVRRKNLYARLCNKCYLLKPTSLTVYWLHLPREFENS